MTSDKLSHSSRGLVISRNPIILLSSIDYPEGGIGVASGIADLLHNRPSLHFLSPSWSLVETIDDLANNIRLAAVALPLARFVVLASDEVELHILYKAGLEFILGNHNIFVNEDVFRPITDVLTIEFDAIYNAKFTPFKNHHLCKGIESLALIHQSHRGMLSNEDEVRSLLAHARIMNEKGDSGSYKRLSPHDVAASINRAATGLCLSRVEGAMISSMEYLLCGTPVVSVRSLGGRDRYLLPPYAEFCNPDAESVAQAVQHLKKIALPKALVRECVENILAFERSNFLDALNIKISDMFGPGYEVTDFEPFRHSLKYKSTDLWRKELSA